MMKILLLLPLLVFACSSCARQDGPQQSVYSESVLDLMDVGQLQDYVLCLSADAHAKASLSEGYKEENATTRNVKIETTYVYGSESVSFFQTEDTFVDKKSEALHSDFAFAGERGDVRVASNYKFDYDPKNKVGVVTKGEMAAYLSSPFGVGINNVNVDETLKNVSEPQYVCEAKDDGFLAGSKITYRESGGATYVYCNLFSFEKIGSSYRLSRHDVGNSVQFSQSEASINTRVISRYGYQDTTLQDAPKAAEEFKGLYCSYQAPKENCPFLFAPMTSIGALFGEQGKSLSAALIYGPVHHLYQTGEKGGSPLGTISPDLGRIALADSEALAVRHDFELFQLL